MKKIIIAFFALSLLFPMRIYASDYVLPYPSYMPGNPLYKARQLFERFQEYWYFGDMAKVKYHLKMSDKYLVEAKILFEYGQMRLAVESLNRSNYHFSNAVLYESDVLYEKKDNGEQVKQLRNASIKHLSVIDMLDEMLPEAIEWQEEKKEKIELSIAQLLKEASIVRKYANRYEDP